MLDLENMRYYLKQEQKRADDAVGQIEKLNDEVNVNNKTDNYTLIFYLKSLNYLDLLRVLYVKY